MWDINSSVLSHAIKIELGEEGVVDWFFVVSLFALGLFFGLVFVLLFVCLFFTLENNLCV